MAAWELEIGTRGMGGSPLAVRKVFNPWDAKIKRTVASAMTTMRAASGDNFTTLDPTVSMTPLEYVATPIAIEIPPIRKSCCLPLKVPMSGKTRE